MSELTPKMILALDSARINGAGIAELRAALAKAGHDPYLALEAYKKVPLKDGRPRGEVNLSHPAEWDTDGGR